MSKERPILFKAAMVRAILDGRKTQTRRTMKPPPSEFFSPSKVQLYSPAVVDKDGFADAGPEMFGSYDRNGEDEGYKFPYGVVGDRLWVKETWAANAFLNLVKPSDLPTDTQIFYRSTYSNDSHFVWRPSIFMPRWASRITLEITAARVERLNEISEAAAEAEGLTEAAARDHHCDYGLDYRAAFRTLWDSINGKCAWDENPWVWVLEFKTLPKTQEARDANREPLKVQNPNVQERGAVF
jgi:hypothetical protein